LPAASNHRSQGRDLRRSSLAITDACQRELNRPDNPGRPAGAGRQGETGGSGQETKRRWRRQDPQDGAGSWQRQRAQQRVDLETEAAA
jgi:hypothetical protein